MQEEFVVIEEKVLTPIVDRIKWLIDHYDGGVKARFARNIGTKNGHVNDWLTGKAKPGPDYVKRICDYYNVTESWLRGFEPLLAEHEGKAVSVIEKHEIDELKKDYYVLKGKFEYSKEINDKFIDRIENILTICEQQQHQHHDTAPRHTPQESATGHEQHDSTQRNNAIRAGHVRGRRETV